MTVKSEMESARKKYGPFNSTHEVYGVLKEEVDEFWQLVKSMPAKKNLEKWKAGLMIRELTQIAAIAQRAIKELESNEIKFI